MIVVDKLCYQSKLRYVNAGEKFAFSMLSLLFCILSRMFLISAAVLAVNSFLTVRKGGIAPGRYIRLMAVPLAFVILSTLAIIVNISKVPLDAYAVPVGAFFITGSRDSVIFGVRLIVTAMSAVSCLYFLSLNTTMTDIMSVLNRLRCPRVIIELMLLIYRYIFVLMETASAILVSQKARLGNRDLRTSVRSFGQMGCGLLIKAFRRSGALYDAMESRCYDGTIRVLEEQRPARPAEIAGIVLFELILLALVIWRRTV